MEGAFNAKTWSDFHNKFSEYKGSLNSFCKENNMTKSQFYYYKKKFSKPSKSTFHAITVNNEETAPKVPKNYPKDDGTVNIEIGKAKICISTGEIDLLRGLIKELINHA